MLNVMHFNEMLSEIFEGKGFSGKRIITDPVMVGNN